MVWLFFVFLLFICGIVIISSLLEIGNDYKDFKMITKILKRISMKIILIIK